MFAKTTTRYLLVWPKRWSHPCPAASGLTNHGKCFYSGASTFRKTGQPKPIQSLFYARRIHPRPFQMSFDIPARHGDDRGFFKRKLEPARRMVPKRDHAGFRGRTTIPYRPRKHHPRAAFQFRSARPRTNSWRCGGRQACFSIVPSGYPCRPRPPMAGGSANPQLSENGRGGGAGRPCFCTALSRREESNAL